MAELWRITVGGQKNTPITLLQCDIHISMQNEKDIYFFFEKHQLFTKEITGNIAECFLFLL